MQIRICAFESDTVLDMRLFEQDDQRISFSVVSMDPAASLILFQRLPVIREDGALELWLTPYQVSETLRARAIAGAA